MTRDDIIRMAREAGLMSEMWEALEAYQPFADLHGFGDLWLKMTMERTGDAAWAAARGAAYAAARSAWAAARVDAANAANAAAAAARVDAAMQERGIAQPVERTDGQQTARIKP